MTNNKNSSEKVWAVFLTIIAIIYALKFCSNENDSSSGDKTEWTPHENYENIGCQYPGCVNGKGRNPRYCDWHTEHH